MSDLVIKVRDGLHLSSVRLTDKPALLEYIGSKEIYATTLNIQHPYLESHADTWLQKRIAHTSLHGKEVSFAIRNADDKLIGAVSADGLQPGTTHRAEIGYWLARPFWGQGIMTDAVRAFVEYAFNELELLRLTAHTFEFNTGSARVLEKNRFKLEGHLRKHFRKDGQLLDARMYGLLRDDLIK
jgi:RimJ/RimL family protein N-acetyltransferase